MKGRDVNHLLLPADIDYRLFSNLSISIIGWFTVFHLVSPLNSKLNSAHSMKYFISSNSMKILRKSNVQNMTF